MAGISSHAALQGFGGAGSTLNMNGNTTFDGQKLDIDKGTLIYEGIERYVIALGPAIQNPNYTLLPNGKVDPKSMSYGTCVDIGIELDGKTYYIPAVIGDIKNHTAPEGYVQTDVAFGESKNKSEDSGNIVEWYTYQRDNENNNKSAGLAQFNDGFLVLYEDSCMK